MIVLSGALVLVALVLLVFGALDRNLPYVYASIGVSVLSLLLLLVGILQRRGELTGEEQDATPVTDASAERVPALVGADQELQDEGRGEVAERDAGTAGLPVPVAAAEPAPLRPASRRVVPVVEDVPEQAPAARDGDVEDDEPEDEHPDDGHHEDHELEADGSGVTVLVVSGRPRYHLDGCRVLRGKEPQALDRDDARHHGFSPCGVCKPDADETAPQVQPVSGATAPQDQGDAAAPQTTQRGLSLTEALFGEPLFADAPAAEAPDRPVQPVEPEAEPAAPAGSRRRSRPAAEPDAPAQDEPLPAELRGDDPADGPTPVTDDAGTPAPSPDAAGPDEPAASTAPDQAGPEPVVQEPVADEPLAEEPAPVVEEPVVQPVAAEDVPVAAAPDEDAVHDVAAPAELEAPAPPADQGAAGKAPDTKAPRTKAARTKAPRTSAPRTTAPRKAPAARAAAAQAPAKTAPTKKAPAKKAPGKKAPATQVAAGQPPVPTAAAPVKRPLVRAVRADALRLGAPSAGGTTTRVSVRAAAPATGGTVVVVADRDRFHRPDCRFAKGVAGATTLPKASAARQGYAACGVCKP